MALTDKAIRAAKPGHNPRKTESDGKPYKLSDSGGLYLEVVPTGGKLWRLKYRIDGREKRLALGSYPAVSLAEARERRDLARKQLANDIDPSAVKKAKKAARLDALANSFEVIAREWHSKQVPNWSEANAKKILNMLENDVFPWIGIRAISDLRAPDILDAIRKVEKRGALESAHTTLQSCGRIVRYAIATGRADTDFTAGLRGALTATKVKHRAAFTEPKQVGELLRALDAYKGTVTVHAALRLLPMLFCRPGELRAAKWSEFDLAEATWSIPAERMKMRRPHIVPLPPQAVAILAELKPVTGRGEHVLPGRDPRRPMSDMTINAALRRLGYDTREEITAHGFRATARTLLHEQLRFDPAVIEHQLAHRVPDALGAAYNRTQFLDERRAMMTAWANYLDTLKADTGRDRAA